METHPRSGGRATEVFRFGPFELSLASGELRKGGIRIALQEQPLRILAALLEEPGGIVSREELCRRLWPEGTFVDFEHSLNAAVRRLRLTLGDVAEVPRFVETVHKRGYRFLPMNERFPRPAPSRLPHGRIRLAVVPFGPHDPFSEGLTEEAITQLALASPPNIGVMAGFPAERLRHPEKSPAEIGRALGADHVVTGGVRRDGDRVRISAHLIELQGDTHLWATTFDSVLHDTLALQVEVSQAIARAVTHALAGAPRSAVGF